MPVFLSMWPTRCKGSFILFQAKLTPRRPGIGFPALRAHLDQVLHTVVLPGLTRLNSEGARLNR